MVKGTYVLKVEDYRRHWKESLRYRCSILVIFLPFILPAVLAMGVIIWSVTRENDYLLPFALTFIFSLLLAVGILAEHRQRVKAWREMEGEVYFEAGETEVLVKANKVQSQCEWDVFIDAHITAQGVHLYVDKQRYLLVSSQVNLIEGDWEAFIQLVKDKVPAGVLARDGKIEI